LTESTIGLEPGVDLLFFRLARSVDALETAGARLARSGLGRWLTVRHSLLGLIGPSQYVHKPTDQERSVLDGEPATYLVVYPFTKSTDWYLQSHEERQAIMNEHMRVGHRYPSVRQLLAYSFGLDDQDFVVAYDTDDLAAFGALVRELRGTQSRRSTIRDTPLLLGVHRPLPELLGRLVSLTETVA
jgi:chlorite dismutase